MVGPAGDVVHVTDILKGWRDDDAPRTSSTSGAAGGAHFNASGGRGRLGSGGTSRSGRGGWNSAGSDFGNRPYWRASGRGSSAAGWSSNAGTERQGGGGGAKASIVSALERAMSRSTYGGGGRMGEPQREKNRSEELFGALMGEGKGRGGTGGWGHGMDGSGRGAAGGKGEDGKNGEVDLGFLHRCVVFGLLLFFALNCNCTRAVCVEPMRACVTRHAHRCFCCMRRVV